jgi:hypothetical protein
VFVFTALGIAVGKGTRSRKNALGMMGGNVGNTERVGDVGRIIVSQLSLSLS